MFHIFRIRDTDNGWQRTKRRLDQVDGTTKLSIPGDAFLKQPTAGPKEYFREYWRVGERGRGERDDDVWSRD